LRKDIIKPEAISSTKAGGTCTMSNRKDKSSKICNVLGGLDVTRFVSSNTRQVFKGAIEDVELIREYVSLAAANQGLVGGFSDLKALNNSLDWKGRGLTKGNTTVGAGLGYVDDRSDRMIDRYVGLREQPLVGDKQNDLMLIDTLSNLFPWIVDRRSVEKKWLKPHQNGRSEGPSKEPFVFDTLYAAAWIGTYGNAWVYYPPMSVFGDGHPYGLGDALGGNAESHGWPFVDPNLPENNPTRRTFLAEPYPDVARQGLSLITALAPIYLTGTFGNYTYNDTYFASTGVDIAVDSTSSLLDTLLDTMTNSSFAVLADMTFKTIVISQTVVERIYPSRTGFEESRVAYDLTDGSIVEDRRNQTYMVSDTIHQGLTELANADWKQLLRDIKLSSPGERGVSSMNLTLTGEEEPREFYVMYERWADVADWVMLAFAPIYDVEHAIDVNVYDSMSGQDDTSVDLQGEWGLDLFGEATMINKGPLDVTVMVKSTPEWFALASTDLEKFTLDSGTSIPLHFNVDTSALDIGVSSFLLTFTIADDGYPDCFYNHDISLPVTVTVHPKDCAALTGDSMSVADANGECVCGPSSVAVGGACARYSVLLPSILVPLIVLGLFCVHLYVRHKRKQADYVWLIKTSDLTFDEPPEILGRGTFGLVVRAEYRGTQVAVKRVIPPVSYGKDASTGSIVLEKDSLENDGEDRLGSLVPSTANKSKRRKSNDYFDFNRSDALDSKTSSGIMNAHIQSSTGSFTHVPNTADSAGANAFDALKLAPTSSARVSAKQYAKLKADFIHEMRLLSKLRHPCITTVMGAVIESGQEPLLVMELMDHGSLFDLLHNSTMIVEGDIVLPILRDVAQGLRFLHAATPQVVHGDLKAQNILVDSKFRAKVADFGLSQKKGVGAAGTPFWMAPELLSGKSKNSAASDVYSFGIILYEVYSRRIPYEGEDFNETMRQICDPAINKRPPFPKSMPPEVESLMAACTNADPTQRPTFRDIDDKLRTFTVGSVEPAQMQLSMQTKKIWDTTLTASENLLLEIFPKHVADALSKGQKVEPQHFECVTIFFSDIVGFTTISSELSPMMVSDMLDRLYTKFDLLSRKHDVFKVETIGDAWMGVTNVATPQPDHAKRIAAFAMDAIKAAAITMIDQEDGTKGFVKIRVGFHSGPVIANVVGSRNPKYTLIGDTVNTSSRMESNSRAGCILCSKASAKLLEEQAPEFLLVSRGHIEVKGKGLMETFWVTPKPEADGVLAEGALEGRHPQKASSKRSRLSDCVNISNFLNSS
jgi:serine/threonine protein kinase